VVETEDQRVIEMLPIEKPKGNYMILEGACEKTKSVMMIQNVPEAGIKLGRGHDCEIRITDISVSRNHALIKFNGTGFYIFDNKSKFGTLVKEDSMNV
jgi:predicted component of type VI protein secretion system